MGKCECQKLYKEGYSQKYHPFNTKIYIQINFYNKGLITLVGMNLRANEIRGGYLGNALPLFIFEQIELVLFQFLSQLFEYWIFFEKEIGNVYFFA